MSLVTTLLILGLAGCSLAQTGQLELREFDGAPRHGDPIIREDFERCEPADAVLLDERKPDTWVLRTKDWPTPLLNAMGNPPDLTYDPQLTGIYDIHIGTRGTDFPVAIGLRLAGEDEFTIISSPRETTRVHRDWEYCFRREVPMDGEKIIIHATGVAAYLDYIKFVPIVGGGKTQLRAATDHVMIASDEGAHFAFPGVARLKNGSLAVVFREGTAHVDPSGKVAMCISTDNGRTWSPRRTIYDDPKTDERDPGICRHSDGTLLVSMASRGARVMRSADNGETWDEPTRAPVFSPHGPRELPDGSIYWCGISTRMGINHVKIATSQDLGRTWEAERTVALSLPYHRPWVRPFWDEPWAIPLDENRWLVLHRVDMDGYLYANASSDGGRTFTSPVRTPMWGCPPFVMRLEERPVGNPSLRER